MGKSCYCFLCLTTHCNVEQSTQQGSPLSHPSFSFSVPCEGNGIEGNLFNVGNCVEAFFVVRWLKQTVHINDYLHSAGEKKHK